MMNRFVAILLIAPLMLAACSGEDSPVTGVDPGTTVSGTNGSGAGGKGQILRRGNGEEPQTLDPHRALGVAGANILRDLYEGLTTETASGRTVPGAALRWNISRDGRTYTFNLRRGARWSNGDPVTAGDFVFGFRRSADPETGSSFVHMLAPIENAEEVIASELPVTSLGVRALDDYTVQIKLKASTPYFLALLSHAATYPVHRPSVAAYGEGFTKAGKLVSNGAYQLTDWVVRSHIELTANPNYWNAGNVRINRVFYYPIEDQFTELQRYRSGDLHWTDEVPSTQFNRLQENHPDELVVTPWLGLHYFGFNLTRPPFKDNKDLRKAMARAVDREILTSKVTRFGERPAFGLVPEGAENYSSYKPDWSRWTQAERNVEAKSLYASAGYTEDNPLQVEIRYNSSENNKKVALAVASMWKQVLGVNSTLINEEFRVFLQNRSQKAITEVFRAGWISDYNDPYSFLELLYSQYGRNDTGYNNPSYDLLLQQAASEHVPAARRRLLEAAEALAMDDQPIVPLFAFVTKRMVNKNLLGWENNMMDHHYSKYMYFSADDDGVMGDNVDGEQAATQLPAETDQ